MWAALGGVGRQAFYSVDKRCDIDVVKADDVDGEPVRRQAGHSTSFRRAA
jgi:hypothetical protein